MPNRNNLKTINKKEQQILEAVKQIKKAEQRIDQEEKEILLSEKKVLDVLHKSPLAAFKLEDGLSPREAAFFRSLLLRKISKHRLIFALVVTVGTVLIWRGIWHSADELPIISSAVVSLVVGIGILWLVKKYTDLK